MARTHNTHGSLKCYLHVPDRTGARTGARLRLSLEGELLRREFLAVNPTLSRTQLDKLYEQIVTLPGCEWYTRKHHSNWYGGNVRRSNSRYTHIKANAVKLHLLRNLLQQNGNPSASTIVEWATALEEDPIMVFHCVLAELATGFMVVT